MDDIAIDSSDFQIHVWKKKLKIYLNTKKCTSENCLGVFSDTLKNVNDDSKLLPVNNDPGEKEKCFIF